MCEDFLKGFCSLGQQVSNCDLGKLKNQTNKQNPAKFAYKFALICIQNERD